MIEEALLNHLTSQKELTDLLAIYDDEPAVFLNEAPADTSKKWGRGSQYGRIVFVEDIQGIPGRTAGGILAVYIMCKKDSQYPEDIEPIIRKLIHGYFFSNGTFTVSAQFKNSTYLTEPTDPVSVCTVAFDLLAFPVLSTTGIDVISRLNEWTSNIKGLYVINHHKLPAAAWKPTGDETAVYWRRLNEGPAKKIRDTYATIWRTATIKGHIFSENMSTASSVAAELIIRLYTDKRLLKPGESPIMVDDRNVQDDAADPLKTGQLTVEATYGIIRYKQQSDAIITNIKKTRKESL